MKAHCTVPKINFTDKKSYNFCEIIIYPPAYTDCCISNRQINKTLSDIFFVYCKYIQTAQKNWDYITERSKNRNDCFVLRNQILIVVKILSILLSKLFYSFYESWMRVIPEDVKFGRNQLRKIFAVEFDKAVNEWLRAPAGISSKSVCLIFLLA